ncbi:hypothetical protein [Streptomyces sp. WAC04114]|nr:hypothetical protein [Streptomyces sp. WAC04114]
MTVRAGERFETPRTLSGNEAPLTTPAVGPDSGSPIAGLEGRR